MRKTSLKARMTGVRMTSRGNTLREKGHLNTQVTILTAVPVHRLIHIYIVSESGQSQRWPKRLSSLLHNLLFCNACLIKTMLFSWFGFSFKYPDYKL